MSEETAKLVLNVFDGTREPIDSAVNILVTLRDGNQQQLHRDFHHGPSIEFDVPFFNNFGDNYAVIVWAEHHQQAGFHPVRVRKDVAQTLDLMLLPNETQFNFANAAWDELGSNDPDLQTLLAAGSETAADAEDRYNQLMDGQPKALACLLNITTAMDQVHLPHGSPLDYFKELIWSADTIKQDRFFAFADKVLLDEVKLAAAQGAFSPEPFPGVFHPGATVSYKQNQFGEANLQLTFHENDEVEIEGVVCVKVESDIDYFKDPLAHALLEVIPNHFKDQQIRLRRTCCGGSRVGTRAFRSSIRRTRSKASRARSVSLELRWQCRPIYV